MRSLSERVPLRACTLAMVGVASLAETNASRAAEPTPEAEPVRLVIDSSPGCPDGAAFRAAVLLRTTRLREAGPGELAREFRVTLASGTPSRGRVAVRGLDGSVSSREVEGESCDTVAMVLELSVAIAVDPAASALLPAAAGPPPSAAVLVPAPAAASVDSPAASAPPTPIPPSSSAGSPPPTPAPTAPRELAAEKAAPAGSRSALGIALAGSGRLATAIAPVPLFTGGVWIEAAFRPLPSLSSAVRGGFELGRATDPTTPGGPVAFTALLATVDACPHSWRLGPASLAPCLRVQAGEVDAHATALVSAPDRRVPWLAAGASASVRAGVVGPLFVAIDGHLAFPLLVETYGFHPAPDFFTTQTPAWGGAVSLGVVLR